MGKKKIFLKGNYNLEIESKVRQALPLLITWGKQGFIALLDQGLFSTANFLLNIFLANWMIKEEYGIFSVLSTLLLFISGVHNAFILEPASVLGPSRYQTNLTEYIKATSKLHFILTFFLGLLLSVCGLCVLISDSTSKMGWGLIIIGFSVPFILYTWWIRRAHYLLHNPSGALLTSFIYITTLLCSVFILKGLKRVNIYSSLLIWVISSILSVVLIPKRRDRTLNPVNFKIEKLVKENFHFGKWVMTGGILYIGAGQIQTFTLAHVGGFEGVAIFRAMYNFFLPMALTVTAVSTLVMPYLSRDFGKNNKKVLIRKGLGMTVVLSGISLLYIVILALSIETLERVLYSGKYGHYVHIGMILSLVPLFTAISSGFSVMLRSMQMVKTYIIVNSGVFLSGITSAWFFVIWWGVEGAAWSLVLVNFISTLINIGLFLSKYNSLQRLN